MYTLSIKSYIVLSLTLHIKMFECYLSLHVKSSLDTLGCLLLRLRKEIRPFLSVAHQ